MKVLFELYITFQKKEVEIKIRHLETPWITKGLRKSPKKNQHLHEKLLKSGQKICL